jgi:hypothetical protein
LDWHITSQSQGLEDRLGHGIGRVALIGVDLDHNALVDVGLMLGLVLSDEVGVHSVGHISRQHERVADGSEVVLLLGAREALRDSGGDLLGDVAIGTLGGRGADFLVVEQDNHVNLSVVPFLGVVDLVLLDQSIQGTETRAQIIQSWRGHEFLMDTHQLRWHRVSQVHLEIDDLLSLDTQVFSHQICQSCEVFVVNIEFIVGDRFNTTLE